MQRCILMHKCTASADGRFQQRAVEILIERNMPHQYLTFKNFPRNTTLAWRDELPWLV